MTDINVRPFPEGFPLLLNSATRKPIWPVLQFLWEKYSCRTSTAYSVACDLKDWWAYLADSRIDVSQWAEAERADIEYYRDVMTQTVSPVTHRPYRPATIRRRVGSVQLFYRWAVSKGLARPPLFPDSVIPTRVGGQDDFVRSMDGAQVAKIFKCLGPLPSDAIEKGAPTRDRLIAEIALNVGLRRSEVVALDLHQISTMQPDSKVPNGICLLKIDRTKGSVTRTVEFPNWLVLELQEYIRIERLAAEKRSGKAQAGLFLNHAHAHRRPGGRVTSDTIDHVFHRAVMASGLTSMASRRDPLTDEIRSELVPQFTFHALRHTFAIWMYYAEFEAGIHEPWKRVQALLGHASLATTLQIYLRPSAAFEGHVSDAVRNVFNGIRDGYAERPQ